MHICLDSIGNMNRTVDRDKSSSSALSPLKLHEFLTPSCSSFSNTISIVKWENEMRAECQERLVIYCPHYALLWSPGHVGESRIFSLTSWVLCGSVPGSL